MVFGAQVHIDRWHLLFRDASGFLPNNFPVSRVVWWRQEGMTQRMRGVATPPIGHAFVTLGPGTVTA